MFCHQTSGPITGWAYNQEGLQPGFYSTLIFWIQWNIDLTKCQGIGAIGSL